MNDPSKPVHETLAEQLLIKDDYLYLIFKSDFTGADLALFNSPLREVTPKFLDDFKYDLHLVVDENHFNSKFVELYEDPNKVYSLKNTLNELISKSGQTNGLKGKAI